MKWDYLVEVVYDDFTGIPAAVPPNRLMTIEERTAFLRNTTALMQGKTLPQSDLSQWSFQKFLQARGQEGWELIHATRMSTGQEFDPLYWRVIFKRLVKSA